MMLRLGRLCTRVGCGIWIHQNVTQGRDRPDPYRVPLKRRTESMEESAYRVIRFQGELLPQQSPSFKCAVSIRIHRWDPASLEVELLWLGDDEERKACAGAVMHLPQNHLMIHSLDKEHPSVQLLGISGVTTNQREATIRASAIEIGFEEILGTEASSCTVIARLQPSGILSGIGFKKMNFTGDIVFERVDEGGIHVQTPVGSFEARETYEYFSTQAHGNKITEQIQRASLIGEITIPAGECLRATHDKIEAATKDVCAALSLCYRQPVGFYEIDYLRSGEKAGVPLLFRHRWYAAKRRRDGDELIAARSLTNGRLEKLVAELRVSPRREALFRSIQFLAASYEATLEVGYFMAFSAMESAINACLDEEQRELVTKGLWKKLEPTLRGAIDASGPENGLSETTVGLMKKKLPELRRAALQSRAEQACDRFKPKTDDLWPKGGFIEGIRQAAGVRNDLFHAAHAAETEEMYTNLVRIRTFTERLLLQVLNWPVEDIWVWYDQELIRVNSDR